jgi:putative ABC transport system ATP-binding protein
MRAPGVGLRARGLSKSFDGGLVRALAGADFAAAPGEKVAITGPTGCGKSTLLSLLALLDEPDAGELLVDGRASAALAPAERWRAENVGIVFQLHHLIPHLTVEENAALPLAGLGLARAERARRVGGMLERAGLAHRAKALATKLSGGERQLAAVARALVGEPRLLLADEPTGSVDSENGERILGLLSGWCRESGATMVLVTHDPNVAKAADRTAPMRDGRFVPSAESR